MSTLPPPEHVTNLTSLVPQSLTRAVATMKSKTSAAQSADLTQPVVEPTRTVLPVKQASSGGLINSRQLAASATAVSNSVIDDSDDEGGAAANFFSLDAANKQPMYPATFKNTESVDVRWSGSVSRVEPAAALLPSDIANISAASADIVWNATNYTSPVTDVPPVCDAAMVCTCLM